ncbi:MAG: PKD domain-containing protein [Bacteroidota bacterium]
MIFQKILRMISIVSMLVIACPGIISGQPTADFEVGEGQDSVCVNENINFTNNSDTIDCSGEVEYEWDFGNGDNSYLENPIYNYGEFGSFTVTLTVTCDGDSDEASMDVYVFPTPIADFETVDYSGCIPYEHSFVNLTTQEGGGGTDNVDYVWTFGDGTSSTEKNPVHEYTQAGSFNIMLEATNENGCSSYHSQENAIMLSDTPVISINADPQSWCYSPVDVNFNSEITVSGSLGYDVEWDFGDGNTSTEENPTHTYTSDGDYDVSVNVTDDYGCNGVVDSLDYIHVHPVTPAYTIYNSEYQEITDDVVCIGESTYFFCDNEGYSVNWDFDGGNPSSSSQLSAEVVFNSSGTHTITLTVDPGGECETDASFDIMVEEPDPSFTIDDDFSCTTPHSVHFTASATVDVDEYHWIFGDGDDGYGEETDHTYENEGHFYPSLEIESIHGCTGSYSGPGITINSPNAEISVDTTEGCTDLEVNANYDGTTDPDDISTFTWDFYHEDPDSIPYVGTESENHVYTDTGMFVVSLVVMDENSCSDTAEEIISVGDVHSPVFDASAYPSEVCPQDSLNFTSVLEELEDSVYIDSYEWLFGDTAEWQWGTSGEHHLEDYTFDQDTGWVQVVHVVEHNGCRDSLFVDSLFYVNSPVIYDITYMHECSEGNEYLLEVDLVEADSWDWVIKDDAFNVIHEHNISDSAIIYEFPGTGEYWVYVIAENTSTGCEYNDSLQIDVIQPEASFSLDPSVVCANVEYVFEESGSQNAEEFYWDFGDGENTGWMPDSDTSHVYHTHGDVNVCLHVKDENGCQDSVCHDLHVAGPSIDVTSAYPVEDCPPYNLIVEGFVVADDPIDSIVVELKEEYNIWQGSDEPDVNGTDSVPFTSEFNLTEAGNYNLTIIAEAGDCTDTLFIPAYIELISIDAGFTAESVDDQDRQVCVGDTIEYVPNMQDDDAYDYEWDFGDDSVSNEMIVMHSYSEPGTYDVSLTVSSGEGCTETEEKTAYIEVQEANAGFSVVNDSISCPPLTIETGDVIHDAPEDPSASYLWTSGYLNEQGNGYNAYEFSYPESGDYYLKLEVETSFGCEDTHQELISIGGPSGDLYVNGQDVDNGSSVHACLHDTLDFSIENGEGIDNIQWTFGEGGSDQGYTTSYVYHNMPGSGNTYRVDARLSGSGCEDIPPLSVYVVIHDVQAAFSLIDTETDEVTDTFRCSPFTLDLMLDTSITSTDDDMIYNWTIEGIGSHTEADWNAVTFENTTQEDSVVEIRLEVENPEVGCWDDTIQQIVIGYIPDPQATSDTIICEGDSLNLSAQGGGEYAWEPELYLSETGIPNPYTTPEEDITYYITVTSSNGCVNEDSVDIDIQYPVISTLGSDQDTIIVGESISNYIETDQENVDILWSPDDNISCTVCENPTFNPKENQEYTVEITDSLGCFTEQLNYDIIVDVRYTLDVPKAFTPKGKPVNRVVYVKGIGIKDLKEFSIYNRWGEKLFQTDDIEQGWDGYYQGELQPVDSYVYYVEAEMWNGNIKTKKGTIMLMQ